MTTPTPPSPFQIGQHMMSLWVPQAIYAAAELGIADVLARGPATAVALAEELATHPHATGRLLDALVVLDLVRRGSDGYELTALGDFLRSDAPSSRRAWARLMGGERVWRAWGKLVECVRTGEPAFARAGARQSETETFDVLFDDPAAAEIFHRAMADGTGGLARDIIAAIDFAGARRVADVGGGYGALLAAVLEAHPELRGFVFDLEHARPGAQALFGARGLTGRADFVAGDLFQQAPPQADVLLLKSVLHDWSDERSLQVLDRCAHAMGADDRLVVIEPVRADPGDAAPPPLAWVLAFSDLNMLVNTGGRERSAAEYTELLRRAGLEVTSVRAAGFYSCLTCRKR